MTTDTAVPKCDMCRLWDTVYHVNDGDGGYKRRCAECLTPEERAAITMAQKEDV